MPLYEAKGDWNPDEVHTAAGDSDYWFLWRGPGGGSSTFLLGREGRLRLTGVVAGKPLSIRILPKVGGALHEEPPVTMGPEETRTVEIVLYTTTRDFHGRVLDVEGRPLAGAGVDLSHQKAGERCSTNSAGEFRMSGIAGGPFTVRVQKSGFAPLFLEGFDLPLDGSPAEFRLSTGHSLRGRVVDTRGRTVKDSSVSIRDWHFHRGVSAAAERDGTFAFSDLPAGKLTLVARVGGVEYEKQVDTLEPEVVIEVPLHGSLDVQIAQADWVERNPQARLLLEAKPDPDPRPRLEMHPRERTSDTLRVGSILPGDYEVWLEAWSVPDDRSPGEWKPIGPAAKVIVRPDEAALLVIVP